MSSDAAAVATPGARLERLGHSKSTAGPHGPLQLPEYLPARMLNEYVYCPRLFFYEWVDGVFAPSAETVEGALRHEVLERKADPLPSEHNGQPDGGRIHARSVQLASETHKLIATIDLLEGVDGRVQPVDYKRGRPRDGVDGPEAWPSDRVQVCAQALVLRDTGYQCDEAVLYYNETKQRVRVAIDQTLMDETLRALTGARDVAELGSVPPPLVDSPKCPGCSLVGICLPDETATAMGWPASDDEAGQLDLFNQDGRPEKWPLDVAPAPLHEVRRLVPMRDDLRPLYVIGHGLTVGKTGDVLQVRDRGQVVQEARLNEVSQVNVFGNVQLTATAIQGLCWAEKPVAHFSTGGWFYGFTHGMGLKNVFLRRAQFDRACEDFFSLAVSRQIVATKIRNQRTLLQRNHEDPPRAVLQQLRQLATRALSAASLESLLGIEGTAARLYFQHFAGMLKVDGAHRPAFDFTHRNRRPPRDPVNALLSLAYAFLTRDFTIVCQAVGFDPYIGFYHQPRFGRPALALDLMEGFRPLVADSTVLSAVNTRMVTPESFIRVGNAVSLTPDGRKGLIRAYEQRIDTLVTHPLFGYRVTYRRVMEIQARLLARFVSGELLRYQGFETR